MDKETSIVFLTIFSNEPKSKKIIEEYADILLEMIKNNVSFKEPEDEPKKRN